MAIMYNCVSLDQYDIPSVVFSFIDEQELSVPSQYNLKRYVF